MRVLALPFAVSLLSACDRSAPSGVEAKPAADAGAVGVTFEPPSEPSGVPPVVRIVLDPPSAVLPEEVVLARGTLGKAHLRELAKGQPSDALAKRLVPIQTFARGSQLVVAPEVPLAADGFTLAIGRLGWSMEIASRTLGSDERVLPRLWPPADQPGASDALVYCDTGPLAVGPIDATLEPGGPTGVLGVGLAPGVGPACVRFHASSTPPAGRWSPPPLLAPGLFLDPAPLVGSTDAPRTTSPLGCVETEVALGPGCATVEDDRLLVRAPDRALLWGVHAPGLDAVRVAASGETFAWKGIAPSSIVPIDLVVLAADGSDQRSLTYVTTEAPRAHVVLNEVMANPLGPEPSQEWVELTNDGLVEAELGGMVLSDVGGAVALPPATLAPGAFALVVPEDFVLEDGLDPGVPEDVLLLRVPKLGKGGLANGGEPLVLRSELGAVLSAFPGAPKPKPGISVVRVRPEAPDEGLTSFALSGAERASPGRPNPERSP